MSGRSKIAFGLISLLLFTNISPANSAKITGTKCIQAKTTKIISGIKYTCIKSGNKLVWNKGIKVNSTITTTINTLSDPIQISTNQLNSSPSETTVSKPLDPQPQVEIKPVLSYKAPIEPSDNIESCKIKENSNSR